MAFWLLNIPMESREDIGILECNLPLCERVPSKTTGSGHGHPSLTHTICWLRAHSPRQPLMRTFFHAQLKLPLCSCDSVVPGVILLHYDMQIWVGNMVSLSVPLVFLTWCGVWASLPCRHPEHHMVFQMA